MKPNKSWSFFIDSSQVISHWAAFSGCCRNAPCRPKGSRRRRLVAETRRHQEVMKLNILSLFLSHCGVMVEKRETLEHRTALRRAALQEDAQDSSTDTHTQGSPREWSSVASYEGTVFLKSHWLCACGRHYSSCASLVTLLFSLFLSSLLSGTTISHFIFIYALHCWSRSKICVSLLQLCTEMVL